VKRTNKLSFRNLPLINGKRFLCPYREKKKDKHIQSFIVVLHLTEQKTLLLLESGIPEVSELLGKR